MNTKRFILSALAFFIFSFLLDWLVHGQMLKGIYEQTAHLWRPEDQHNLPFMFFSQAAFAVMFAFIFTRHVEGKGVAEGLRYGLYIGLLIAAIEIGTYCYMPIPLILSVSWAVAAIVKGVIGGAILALVYKA